MLLIYWSFVFMFMMGGFCCLNFSVNYLISVSIFSKFHLNLLMDSVSLTFLSFLFMMVSSVICFSVFYMENDTNPLRFLGMLLSFVLSMIFLMMMPDFYFLLLGWDGLGVSSFLLILYYLSKNSWLSSFKTFLMNRIGDSLLIIVALYLLLKKDFLLFSSDYLVISMMGLLLILGLFTKSAIFPFCSWLPAAMAAPTPVSSLVHSSTLVTAGVYLALRKYFWLSNYFLLLVVLGFFTMSMASFAAYFEFDSKKIVAYSTLSQLGLMIVILSMGNNKLCFFHLVSHACFKALLFMCCGLLMFSVAHNQDFRFYGGLMWISSLLKVVFLTCKLSLSGLFFLSGFYSKDKFLELSNLNMSLFLKVWFLVIVGLTLLYSFRLVLSMFFSVSKVSINMNIFWLLLSILPLWVLSMFTGSQLKKYYFLMVFSSSFYNWVLMVILLLFFYLMTQSMNFKKTKMDYFSSISFLFFFNSSHLVYKLSKVGFLIKNLFEGGAFLKLLSKTKSVLVKNSKILIKKMFLGVQFNFFFWMTMIFFFIMLLMV